MVTRIATCKDCNQTFCYTAPSWHGKGRVTCDAHRDQRRKANGRNRVRRYRVNESKRNELPAMTVHIMACGGKTYCGNANWGSVSKAVSDAIRAGRVRGRICKTCRKLFDADTGGAL